MRINGGYSLHQSLTTETAIVVKQAVGLARRRGHTQVTPLHVAVAMLSCWRPAPLLRWACLEAHSHPLQSKALHLCFNVALNRLPTALSSSSSLLGHGRATPSLSNALVAAFKRAQAQQRRGSVENHHQQQQQQQPAAAAALALRVEVGQLTISILDDPSVSRVMREAGFSSSHIKASVERALSLHGPARFNNFSSSRRDEVDGVFEAMTSGKTRNNVVVVGECAAVGKNVVRKVIERFERKEVPIEMKSVELVRFPISGLRGVLWAEVEARIEELRSVVRARSGGGVVVYLGDLDWFSDQMGSKYEEDYVGNYYYYHCPLEHVVIMEISRMVSENKRVWLMGVATFETYSKCKKGSPSLEALWSLQPVRIPVASLELGLSLKNSDMQDQVIKVANNGGDEEDDWLLYEKAGFIIEKQLICCSSCSDNFKKEARAHVKQLQMTAIAASTSKLPPWLQQYKDENPRILQTDAEQEGKIEYLCKKWNSICSSIHSKPDFLSKLALNTPVISSSSSPSSTSVSSTDPHKPKLFKWPVLFETVPKPDLLSNPNSSPNSATSSENNHHTGHGEKISHDPDNLDTILLDALEKNLPWQKRIIPEIVSTISKCRSGMSSRKKAKNGAMAVQESCWLFFSGTDNGSKVAMARQLAKTVFGSHEHFVHIDTKRFADQTSGCEEEEEEEEGNSSKYSRRKSGDGYTIYETFAAAVGENPSRVFYVGDGGHWWWKGFVRGLKDGGVEKEVNMKEAIVIFSCEEMIHSGTCEGFDLNMAMKDGEDDDIGNFELEILGLVDHKVVFQNFD